MGWQGTFVVHRPRREGCHLPSGSTLGRVVMNGSPSAFLSTQGIHRGR